MNLSLFFRTSCNISCFLLVCFFSVAVGFSQESRPSTDSFDRIEARLQQMRSKFEAIGNRTSPSSTLLAPDSSRVDNSPRSITGVQDSETPSPVSESEDNQIFQTQETASESSMESAFGDYYFQAFCGYVVPSDVSFETGKFIKSEKMLEADSAYQLGISGGKRFGNWMTELSLSYGAMDYDEPVNETGTYIIADGEGTSVDVALNLSYSALVTLNSWVYLGVGGGVSFRDDSYVFVMKTHPSKPQMTSSDATAFSYNAFVGVGYSFTDLISLKLGYRYAGVGSNNKFGSLRNHVFEGSLGASF